MYVDYIFIVGYSLQLQLFFLDRVRFSLLLEVRRLRSNFHLLLPWNSQLAIYLLHRRLRR
jgi:hypothetical protein